MRISKPEELRLVRDALEMREVSMRYRLRKSRHFDNIQEEVQTYFAIKTLLERVSEELKKKSV